MLLIAARSSTVHGLSPWVCCRRWIELVEREGGQHHGCFLPAEGASDQALALFTFESLSAYGAYRARFGVDPEFIAADRLRTDTGRVVRWDRTILRPLPR